MGKGSRRQDEPADMVWYSVMKDSVNPNRWFELNHLSNKPVRDIFSKWESWEISFVKYCGKTAFTGERIWIQSIENIFSPFTWDKENYCFRYLPLRDLKYSWKNKANTKNQWENNWVYYLVPDCVARAGIAVKSEKGALYFNHLSFEAFPTWWRSPS